MPVMQGWQAPEVTPVGCCGGQRRTAGGILLPAQTLQFNEPPQPQEVADATDPG